MVFFSLKPKYFFGGKASVPSSLIKGVPCIDPSRRIDVELSLRLGKGTCDTWSARNHLREEGELVQTVWFGSQTVVVVNSFSLAEMVLAKAKIEAPLNIFKDNFFHRKGDELHWLAEQILSLDTTIGKFKENTQDIKQLNEALNIVYDNLDNENAKADDHLGSFSLFFLCFVLFGEKVDFMKEKLKEYKELQKSFKFLSDNFENRSLFSDSFWDSFPVRQGYNKNFGRIKILRTLCPALLECIEASVSKGTCTRFASTFVALSKRLDWSQHDKLRELAIILMNGHEGILDEMKGGFQNAFPSDTPFASDTPNAATCDRLQIRIGDEDIKLPTTIGERKMDVTVRRGTVFVLNPPSLLDASAMRSCEKKEIPGGIIIKYAREIAEQFLTDKGHYLIGRVGQPSDFIHQNFSLENLMEKSTYNAEMIPPHLVAITIHHLKKLQVGHSNNFQDNYDASNENSLASLSDCSEWPRSDPTTGLRPPLCITDRDVSSSTTIEEKERSVAMSQGTVLLSDSPPFSPHTSAMRSREEREIRSGTLPQHAREDVLEDEEEEEISRISDNLIINESNCGSVDAVKTPRARVQHLLRSARNNYSRPTNDWSFCARFEAPPPTNKSIIATHRSAATSPDHTDNSSSASPSACQRYAKFSGRINHPRATPIISSARCKKRLKKEGSDTIHPSETDNDDCSCRASRYPRIDEDNRK